MANDTFSSDDFDKLLDDFIASQLQDTEDSLAELHDSSNKKPQNKSSDTSQNDESVPDNPLSPIVEKTIDENAFKECTSLSSIKLNKVTTIKSQAFYGCNSLQIISIPSFVSTDFLLLYPANHLESCHLVEVMLQQFFHWHLHSNNMYLHLPVQKS